MKPDYRFSLAITSLLIFAVLIMPPWKNSLTGQFSGFYYLFSEADVVRMLELDYARLAIIIIGIALLIIALHLFLITPFVTNIKTNVIQNNNFIKFGRGLFNFVKMIIIFLLIYVVIFSGINVLLNV